MVEPSEECGGVLEMSVAEEVGTAEIIARDKSIDLVEMQDSMGIVEEQRDCLLGNAIAPCGRFEIDAHLCLGMVRVEVKQVDSTKCFAISTLDDESQLEVLVDITSGVVDIVT